MEQSAFALNREFNRKRDEILQRMENKRLLLCREGTRDQWLGGKRYIEVPDLEVVTDQVDEASRKMHAEETAH